MMRTAVSVAAELPAGRMQRLGRVLTTLGERTSLEDELNRMNRITLDELRQVADEWPMQAIVTGRMMPLAV